MAVKEKKQDEAPVLCACGSEAVIVVYHGKKMVSCPNPEKCIGNLRTQWYGSKKEAIAVWNTTVNSFKFTRR